MCNHWLMCTRNDCAHRGPHKTFVMMDGKKEISLCQKSGCLELAKDNSKGLERARCLVSKDPKNYEA